MDPRLSRLWDEMLEEFRALGGVAENIRLGHGRFGRGLFPIDPKKPVCLAIPPGLLVAFDDVSFENDVFRLTERAPVSGRGRAFLEQYERDFGWGVARGETEHFLHAMNELPDDLKQLLRTEFDIARFLVPISPPLVQRWFFETRLIQLGERRVIMPIIGLSNHGGTATYNVQTGVSLSGTFEDEVLVRYAGATDPYDMFLNWMFVPNEPTAFSVPVRGPFEGRRFDIRRDFEDAEPPFVPQVTVAGDRIVVNFLLLGHQRLPKVPKGAFRRAMASAGLRDVDELYDIIQLLNRQKFLDLLTRLHGLDLPGAAILRRLACNQLTALSHHFGVQAL